MNTKTSTKTGETGGRTDCKEIENKPTKAKNCHVKTDEMMTELRI